MTARPTFHIGKCASYVEQESEELGDEVVARLNPRTGEVNVATQCRRKL
jgi:hypothetical protein